MKTIKQLLELSQNPYYVFTKEEKAVLDAFLSQRAATTTAASQAEYSVESLKKTPVTVRNIVHKVDTYPPEAS